MDFKDLRVGNVIKFKYGEDEFNIIESIDSKQIGLGIITSFKVEFDDIEGIPLTREWLGRLGYRPFGKDFVKDGIILHTRKRGYVITTKVPIMKYVHNLQNYHYTNRGKELTILGFDVELLK